MNEIVLFLQIARKVAPSFETPDPRKELEIRANVLNLSPPIYKMYSKKEKHSNKITIYASVKVSMSIALYIIALN